RSAPRRPPEADVSTPSSVHAGRTLLGHRGMHLVAGRWAIAGDEAANGAGTLRRAAHDDLAVSIQTATGTELEGDRVAGPRARAGTKKFRVIPMLAERLD